MTFMILKLRQGSPEWHQHRATARNASDAPAMLGISPYKSRADFLRERATGITPDVTPEQQRIFDRGHRIEELARPLAEKVIGEELSPCVGTDGTYSASFDGITFVEDVAWECKTLNASLRQAMPYEICDDSYGARLPEHYRAQMEQQALVSGCERILFTAASLDEDGQIGEVRHCWYTPDSAMRARIISGWEQFEKDVAAYVVPDAAPAKVVAEAVTALPAVFAQVTGSIDLKDNLPEYEVALRDFIEHRLIRQPETDLDFASLDLQIKALKGAEAALDASEEQALSQAAMLSAFKRQKDMLHKLTRDTRLAAEKLLAAEKERIKLAHVQRGQKAFAAHIANLNTRLGKPYMPQVPSDFAGSIKGKRTVDSLRDAVDTELARAKIAANEIADRIQINLTTLRELASQHAFLFSDTAAIVLKAPDDLTTLVKARIAEHAAQEAARLEAERERIRQDEERKALAAAEKTAEAERQRIRAEEQQRAQAEAAERMKQAQEQAHAAIEANRPALEAAATAFRASLEFPVPTADPGVCFRDPPENIVEATSGDEPDNEPTLKLGDINARLAPLSISTAGMAQFGIEALARDKSAHLFSEAQFARLLMLLTQHIQNISQLEAA
ncbi:MAG: YqaJ viral recombinase family protein [Candidatus Paceibacterota bacterium]|jgi:putative phage-type endonuclease